MNIIVKKFGGTSVSSISKLKKIAENLAKEVNARKNILVVLSAMGKSTDKLVEMSNKISKSPNPRDYDMLLDLLDYQETVGHLSVYYDAGELFNIQVNAGKYLAGDWGATTTISRKFGSGWEVGGYATFTDVPFATFGEGSFDKAIYISIPMDWIISKPQKTKRILTLRPITRDGGANLASSRQLYRYVKDTQNSQFYREFGRLWK